MKIWRWLGSSRGAGLGNEVVFTEWMVVQIGIYSWVFYILFC